MREPSIFNPIFDINDIRSMEFECGPKKRKALDGILIGPSPLKYNGQESTVGDSSLSPLSSNQSSKDIKDPSPVIAVESGFSPGSVEDAKLKRKRGRPMSNRIEKSSNDEDVQLSTQRRRGRPAKANPSVGVKPNVFKRNQKRSAAKQKQTIKAHWDNEMFDLTVDLDNHFDADKNKVIGIISYDPPERPWIIMGIYGPPSFGEKEEFWKKVGEYIDQCNFPLLLMGDLNGTLKHGENLNYANASNTTRAWIEKGHRHPMVNLHRKIKHTKDHLTKWNKERFKKLSVQINEARVTLKSIEEAKNFDEKAHSKARADLEERLRKEIFRCQTSRVAWLKDGDRSTKFFMASTVTRRRRKGNRLKN
ncbi:hypothetical protein G4B88_030073 [Cannabis sativa]|uniref:Endonuclease/exonuclease/phosphatase domain-containing protein n=1 Tax=Cannabis sativa TaxID=3483 RepID=A0A7J6FVG4_CANSA|nr:hypothetical protein G4B88_030073 [Cannabis sativa]